MNTPSARKTCRLTNLVTSIALLVLPPAVVAGDRGTISFTGRIVNSTCTITSVNAADPMKPPRVLECGMSKAGFAADPTAAIVRTQTIDANSPDQLLRYFYQNAKASGVPGANEPTLVTLEYR